MSESLIDDGDNGFERFRGPDWTYSGQGFNDDSWLAPATTNSNQSRHSAIWVPVVEDNTEYNVEVFIPSGINATTGAIYEMYIKDGSGTSSRIDAVVNQSNGENDFITINTVTLENDESIAVILRDLVLDGSSGDYVVFDALRITPVASVGLKAEDQETNTDQMIKINSAYPNPFNSSVTIGYETSINSTINMSLFDVFGRAVFTKNNIKIQAGRHSFSWDGENNFGLDIDKLVVSEAYVGKSIVMKRMRPRARGRAARILKPFSKLTILLKEIEEGK